MSNNLLYFQFHLLFIIIYFYFKFFLIFYLLLVFLCFFFFFFSSRRRHTRCLSDWSSDVCSSDLIRIRRSAATRSSCTARASSRRARASDREASPIIPPASCTDPTPAPTKAASERVRPTSWRSCSTRRTRCTRRTRPARSKIPTTTRVSNSPA